MPDPRTLSIQIPGTRKAVAVQVKNPLSELEFRKFMSELERRKPELVEGHEIVPSPSRYAFCVCGLREDDPIHDHQSAYTRSEPKS